MRTNAIIFALLFALLSVWTSSPAYAGGGEGKKEDPIEAVMHHIGDAHEFHIVGDIHLPLPCIAYSSDAGFFFSLSNAFQHGNVAIDGYMMHHSTLYRIKGLEDSKGEIDLSEPQPKVGGHDNHGQVVDTAGVHGGEPDHSNLHGASVSKEKNAEGNEALFLNYKNVKYELIPSSTVQGLTTWYDFSITKNVFAMLLGVLLLFIIFRTVRNGYKVRKNQAPKGLQSLMEVLIVFMRDEVAKPSIGTKWEKYFPFLLSLFFFILVNNLLGLVPFFPGSANVTGNLGTTMILAIFTFLVVNFSGNKHYWEHVFWMPGVPFFVKLILTPIEVIGLFLKPITLLIRLFANITAGHIIILSLVSLIFIFNNENILGGGPTGIAIAVPFVFALNFMELLVAFIQAFLFTLLSAVYIGAAVEEHHHHDDAATDTHH